MPHQLLQVTLFLGRTKETGGSKKGIRRKVERNRTCQGRNERKTKTRRRKDTTRQERARGNRISS